MAIILYVLLNCTLFKPAFIVNNPEHRENEKAKPQHNLQETHVHVFTNLDTNHSTASVEDLNRILLVW